MHTKYRFREEYQYNHRWMMSSGTAPMEQDLQEIPYISQSDLYDGIVTEPTTRTHKRCNRFLEIVSGSYFHEPQKTPRCHKGLLV
jgi:hypothetical protein